MDAPHLPDPSYTEDVPLGGAAGAGGVALDHRQRVSTNLPNQPATVFTNIRHYQSP